MSTSLVFLTFIIMPMLDACWVLNQHHQHDCDCMLLVDGRLRDSVHVVSSTCLRVTSAASSPLIGIINVNGRSLRHPSSDCYATSHSDNTSPTPILTCWCLYVEGMRTVIQGRWACSNQIWCTDFLFESEDVTRRPHKAQEMHHSWQTDDVHTIFKLVNGLLISHDFKLFVEILPLENLVCKELHSWTVSDQECKVNIPRVI